MTLCIKMHATFGCFLKRQILTISCQKTTPVAFTNIFSINNKNLYCTSAPENSTGPVALSYAMFQPENSVASQVPVVILHGLLGSKQNWRGLGKAIAVRTKRKVYTLDARNHGDSPHISHMNYPVMAEDVKYFLSSRTIPEAVIVGHSMGGRTAMHLALANEDVVSKLVVVDVTPGKLASDSQVSLRYMLTMSEILSTLPQMGLVQARRNMNTILQKTIPEESIRQFLLSNLTEINKSLFWKPNMKVLIENFSSEIIEFRPPSGYFMKETLFICGGNSSYVPAEDYPYIKSLFPKADISVIPGAGHWVHSEKSSEFLEILCNFL